MTARISIILPLYNAARHIPTGLASIAAQTFQDFEVIAVDDGATDNTRELFEQFTRGWKQPIKYIQRQNGGGFAARNTGLDQATGEFIAFFDIDDRWYPGHLQECLDGFSDCPEADWIYGPNRIIDLTEDGREISPSNFYSGRTPYPFLALRTIWHGTVKLIADPRAVTVQLAGGLRAGQQFSLIRTTVFENYRFRADYRNETADQIALIRAIKTGFKIGYLDTLQGEYALHESNASAGCKGADSSKYIRLKKAEIRGFLEMAAEINLSAGEKRALNCKIAGIYFWDLGYNLHWRKNQRPEAFDYFREGLRRTPTDIRMLKTWLLCKIRSWFTK